MELNRDFSEFIASCVAHDVRFMIVGGYAVAAHGHPRFTKDLDVWVWVDKQNAHRLIAALDDFGFGSVGLTADDFLEEGMVVQLGYPPKRIDIITQVDGVEFDPAGNATSKSGSAASAYRSSPSRTFSPIRRRPVAPRTSPMPPPSSSYPPRTTTLDPLTSPRPTRARLDRPAGPADPNAGPVRLLPGARNRTASSTR